jgi:preprotein translocase subunit SecB
MKAKQTVSSPAADNRAYLRFLSGLQLRSLGLKGSSTTLDRELFWDFAQKKDKTERRLTEAYEPTVIGRDSFGAEARYELTISEEDRVALKIECVFEVHMQASSSVEPSMAERFSKSDLRFIVLPYARHFVTDVTGQMQIPPIVLPLITAAGKARVDRAEKRRTKEFEEPPAQKPKREHDAAPILKN